MSKVKQQWNDNSMDGVSPSRFLNEKFLGYCISLVDLLLSSSVVLSRVCVDDVMWCDAGTIPLLQKTIISKEITDNVQSCFKLLCHKKNPANTIDRLNPVKSESKVDGEHSLSILFVKYRVQWFLIRDIYFQLEISRNEW